MMFEEADGVDVNWEEDGKGGKKAVLVVSQYEYTVWCMLVIEMTWLLMSAGKYVVGCSGRTQEEEIGTSSGGRGVRC